jgi:hypothetical protein
MITVRYKLDIKKIFILLLFFELAIKFSILLKTAYNF